MAEQELDRNESATPFKLEKARERGQAAKSPEVVSAVVFGAAVVYFTWQGAALLDAIFSLARALFGYAFRVNAASGLSPTVFLGSLESALFACLPLFLTMLVAACAGNLFQTGPMLSAEPLKPDWERINPVAGFKRIFSWRTLFDGAKACVKLVILIGIAIAALSALMHQFYGLANVPAQGFVFILLRDVGAIGLQMAMGLALIALIDLVFTRREFAKKMRMSRRELKDEVKHREGDPRIRFRLRELRREMFKKAQAIGNTRHSDVVIVNPTHYAVALKYDESSMTSPQVVAKGTGRVAYAIRKIAESHRIPIVQNPPLARGLFKEVDVEQFVPVQMYADVARIVVWVFFMKARSMRKGTAS